MVDHEFSGKACDLRFVFRQVAAVELRAGAPAPSEAELIAFARDHLTHYCVPTRVKVVAEIPRTPSLKPSAPALRDWTVGYWEALHPFSAGGAYVNFMMDEGQARVKATYGANYARLAQVKATYDPDNVFRVNQNIEPALT